MSHRKASRRKTRAVSDATATSAPLAFLLRDPHSADELRRTIDAWSRFIERHLHDEYTEVRVFAHRSVVRRAAAYAVLGEHEAALADVDLALAEASHDTSLQYKALEIRAIVQADQEDHAGALATFAEIWPLLPAVDLPAEERAELWLERGKCYGRLKRYEEAISDFTQALSLDATFGEALCWRGLAQGFLEQKETALADANAALTLEPQNATFLRIRGILLRIANRFGESMRDLLQAEALAPEDPWVKLNKDTTLNKWLFCRGPQAIEEMEEVFASLPAKEQEKQAPPPFSKVPNQQTPIPPLSTLAPPSPQRNQKRTQSNHQRTASVRSRHRSPRSDPRQGQFF